MAILNKVAQDVLDGIQADIVEAAKGYLSSAMEYLGMSEAEAKKKNKV